MTTRLNYVVAPTEIDYSVGDQQLSIVSLTITGQNESSADVACSRLSFEISVGAGTDSLTLDPSTIVAAPGPSTPWAIGGGDATWYALPVPPATGVPAGAEIQFVLSDVVVNTSGGTTDITVTETTDAVATGTIPVKKSAPVPAGSVPAIVSFTADPEEVGQGATSTLSWQITDADSAQLLPVGIPLPDPRAGTLPLPVTQTTNFTLKAFGTGGAASASVAVAVMPVEITSFTASVTAPVRPGTQVELAWTTLYGTSCSIDQGVGPVPASGSTSVSPTQTTVYTLTANGLQKKSQSVTVTVAQS